MKVICPVSEFNGEPIEHTECLDCAKRLKTPPCNMVYPVLKTLFYGQIKDRENGVDRDREIHVTDLISCLLSAWHKKVMKPPVVVTDLWFVTLGQAVHAFIEQANADDPYVTQEEVISDVGNKILGRVDAIVDGMVIDFKTTRKAPANGGYGDHAAQLQAYQALLDSRTTDRPIERLLVQYIDFFGKTSIVEVGLGDSQAVLRQLQLRAAVLKDAMERNDPPDAEPGWKCKYCSFMDCAYNKKGAS